MEDQATAPASESSPSLGSPPPARASAPRSDGRSRRRPNHPSSRRSPARTRFPALFHPVLPRNSATSHPMRRPHRSPARFHPAPTPNSKTVSRSLIQPWNFAARSRVTQGSAAGARTRLPSWYEAPDAPRYSAEAGSTMKLTPQPPAVCRGRGRGESENRAEGIREARRPVFFDSERVSSIR